MKSFHTGGHPAAEHEIIGTRKNDSIYAKSDGHPGNQIHIFTMDGDDAIKLSMSTSKGRWISHGQHVFAGRGRDDFIFTDLDELKGTIIGRLDDFNPADDRIFIDGQLLDLSDPGAIRGYKVSFVQYTDPLNIDRITDTQQWLKIETASGGRVLYALEGARRNPGYIFEEEVHFLRWDVKVPTTLPVVDFEDPVNFLSAEVIDRYLDRMGPFKFFTKVSETISGDQFANAIDANKGEDLVYGRQGDDLLIGGLGDDTIYGGVGNDAIEGGKGRDSLFGGAGNDIISGGTDEDFISGGPGDDSIYGGSESDTLHGGAGNDFIHSGTGDDVVYGGQGNDYLLGQRGEDRLFGGAGNDKIYGGEGNDSAYGESGRDTLYGGAGNDYLHGGRGDDAIYGGIGRDQLYGGQGNDTLDGGAGNDNLRGGQGRDLIYAGAGSDRLYGGLGHDKLYGSEGNDTLVGGPGVDLMFGGSGADVFVFASIQASGLGKDADVIYDFQAGSDKIDLRGMDANTFVTGNQSFVFSGTENMAHAVWSEKERGGGFVVYGDVDGDGKADFSIQFHRSGVLHASDFLL